MKKLFLTLLILFPLVLTGCAKTEEVPLNGEDAGTPPALSDEAEAEKARFSEMTEEERIQEMIRLIEAEEAKMEAAESVEEGADEVVGDETAE